MAATSEPTFDPAAWAARWTALGGRIEWDGLRWPFPIWLETDKPGDELRLMPLDLTAEQGEALRVWALAMMEPADE